MSDQPFLFRYSSSNNGSLDGGYLAQERLVTLWTDPTPKDASAQEEEEKERILERNRFHWQNSHEYTNVIMTPTEFEEYILQGLEMSISVEPQDDLETFQQGFQRLQERYQTHSFPGILPISYHKDQGNPNREYRPMERAILTPTTSHIQRSRDRGFANLQQTPQALQLIATLMYGKRTGVNQGVCPMYVQVPQGRSPPTPKTEQLCFEIAFPDFNHLDITFQIMETKLTKSKSYEYIEIGIHSRYSSDTSNREIELHWRTIGDNLTIIRDRISQLRLPSFLKTDNRKRRRTIQTDHVAFLNPRRPRRV